jgi:hypothetical protein
MAPADPASRAGAMPEASGDTSSGTFGKNNMKTHTLVIALIATAICPIFGADLFPVIEEKPISELALKAIIAHRPDLNSSDLKLASIDCRYFYNNDYIPDDGKAHKHANAIVTFIIIPTRKESIQENTKIAEYQALSVTVAPDLAPAQMRIEETRIAFSKGT